MELNNETKTFIADTVKTAVAPLAELLKSKATNNAPPGGGADPVLTEREQLDKKRRKWAKKTDPAKGKGIDFTRYLLCLAKASVQSGGSATGRPDFEGARKIAEKEKLPENIVKALQEQTMIDGGALTPDVFSQDFIELLRPSTVVRRSGARVIPMSGGSLTMGRQNAAGTASYVGEGQSLAATQQQFGQLQLQVKKLMAVTPISNDLLRDAVVSAEMLVRDDLVKICALAEDLAFIRGAGTVYAPKGIRNWVPAANVINALQAGSIATAAEVIQSLQSMLYILEQSNIPMVGIVWYMTPRTKWFLKSLRDSVGAFIFRPEMEGPNPTLFGYPLFTTTQIPQNLNELGNNNESEVYLGVSSEYLIGENTQVLVQIFRSE